MVRFPSPNKDDLQEIEVEPIDRKSTTSMEISGELKLPMKDTKEDSLINVQSKSEPSSQFASMSNVIPFVVHLDEKENSRPEIIGEESLSTNNDGHLSSHTIHSQTKDVILEDEYFPANALAEAQQIFEIQLPPRVPNFRERTAMYQINTRFVLLSIVMENFKSYANRVAIGPFHRNFTCIIGPNGSGKSNTIDALLFVFGYQSKRLRAAKLSELIHHSEKFPNCTWCRVTVRFGKIIPDANDIYAQMVIPNTEYSIAREAHKDGSSFYLIDGERATQKDVRTRLRQDNIDLDHNRFLILQGEVEQIAMMKPKGKTDNDSEMLEFIEEIVGTNQYKEPIAKMAVITEELAAEEEHQNKKVLEFHKELVSMEAVKTETERFLTHENEIIHRRHIICQLQRAELMQEQDVLLTEVKEMKDQLNKLGPEKTSVAAHHKLKLQESQELQKYVRDYEKGDSKADKEYTAAQSRKESLETSQKALEELIPRLEKEKAKFEHQLADKEDEPERIRGQQQEIELNGQKARQAMDVVQKELTAALARVPEELGDRHERIATLEKTLGIIRPLRNEKRRNLDNKEEEFRAFGNKHARAVERQVELETQQTNLRTQLEQSDIEILEIKTRIPDLEHSVNQLQRNISDIRKSKEKLNAYFAAKCEQIEIAEAQNRIQTNNTILRTLLEAQRNGELSGIIGRMGDLGTIAAKYDVAISTNYVGRLDNIVVEDAKSSKEAVEYLKRTGAGRATFLVLEKLSMTDRVVKHMNKPFQMPNGAERLFDLINTDARFRPLFYYVLGDTLVSNDLDSAKTIAYGTGRPREEKYCVVTLDGKQVDGRSGGMTGGGEVIRGKLRSDAQGVQLNVYSGPPLEQLRAEKDDLVKNGNELQTKLTSIEENLHTAEGEVVTAKNRLRELQEVTAKDRTLQESLPVRITQQKKVVEETKLDPICEARFQKEIDDLKVEHDAVDEQYKSVEAKIKIINDEIQAITEHLESPLRKREKDLQSTINQQEKASADLKKQLDSHESKIKRLRSDIEKRTMEIKSKSNELVTVKAELLVAAENLGIALKKRNESRAGFDERKASMQLLLEEVEKVERKLEHLERQIEHLTTKVDKRQGELDKYGRKMAGFDRELREFKLHDHKNTEFGRNVALRVLESAELEKFSTHQLQDEIDRLVVIMNAMQPNLQKLKEYYDTDAKRHELMDAVETVRRKRKLGFTFFMYLKNRRFTEFTDALRTIKTILKTTYRQLTLGGDASLEPIDRFDPFADGLEFMVKPKSKSWKHINYLSGGEKTISSLALIFSLHYFKPTPFYIMDEIDAALDFRNTSIIAFFVKDRAVSSQFIIVSLRNQMFEMAYRLIGICKPEHQSVSMYIDPLNHVVHDENDKEDRGSRQTTASMFSQATQAIAFQEMDTDTE